MESAYLIMFYKVVALMESEYDVEYIGFEECAAIAAEVTEKAWAEYDKQDENGNFINGWDCVDSIAIVELDKQLTRKREG